MQSLTHGSADLRRLGCLLYKFLCNHLPRNPYDIVTEGIISIIPVKFRLQSYVKHYSQTNFPKFRLDLTLLGVGFRWVCLQSELRYG